MNDFKYNELYQRELFKNSIKNHRSSPIDHSVFLLLLHKDMKLTCSLGIYLSRNINYNLLYSLKGYLPLNIKSTIYISLSFNRVFTFQKQTLPCSISFTLINRIKLLSKNSNKSKIKQGLSF